MHINGKAKIQTTRMNLFNLFDGQVKPKLGLAGPLYTMSVGKLVIMGKYVYQIGVDFIVNAV